MRTLLSLPLLTTSLLLLSTPALADRIFKVDGSTIDDVTILKETLSEVEYKSPSGRATKTVPTFNVLRTTFEKLPDKLDSAQAAILEERYLDAINDINEFLARFSEKPPRTAPWSVPYAYNRLVEINESMGDYGQVVAAANMVLEKAPGSRYAPLAHLSKIEALNLLGDAGLKDAVGAFNTFVETNSLQSRWRLEAELRGVLFDAKLQGKARRDRLQQVVTAAGKESPVVANRATVAIGESHLAERQLKEAQTAFEKVVTDPKADNLTLAAAHTGLGDCLFQLASNAVTAGEDASVLQRRAYLNYLRVVVLYPDQVQYVPRAMFYAGRIFQEIGDEESNRRAKILYFKLIKNFPGSKFAKEARPLQKKL